MNERTTDVIHVLIICTVLAPTKKWNISYDKLKNQTSYKFNLYRGPVAVKVDGVGLRIKLIVK